MSTVDSSPAPGSSPAGSSRRKSGRVTKKPARLSTSIGLPAKRKRSDKTDDGITEDQDGDVDMEDDASEESSDDDEEPDVEEVKERKKRARKSTGSTAQRAAKKPKQNGSGTNLAIRSAPAARPKKVGAKTRPKKAARFSSAEDAGGLYAEVFGKGNVLDDIAAEWIAGFETDDSQPIADLFTFIFRCAGCEHKVESHEVLDEDHFPQKIADVREEYQAQNVTEYPLISKSRGTAAFRQTYTGFVRSLILTLAKSNVLFDKPIIMEIIYTWVAALCSTNNRPFRHTATVAALTIMTTLCEVGRETAEGTAKTLRQAEGEKKKGGRGVNKGRVAELDAKVKESSEKEETVKGFLGMWFDAMFVHRYRDVDFRIRVDCMQALAEWITIYPEVYFESQYMRYIGWVLSDAHAHARLEAVRALLRQYNDKDKLSGLRTFTERFRPRLVEMAERDSEPSVRAAAIELLDVLREAGFLEPTELDSIGKLVFDTEPRVRKAVVNFFAELVNESYEARIEELGGQEAVEEVVGALDPDDEDFDSPRLEWLKTKCLVEQLHSFDAAEEVEANEFVSIPGSDAYMLVPGQDSRFSLAAEVLCERIPELKWEILAGYLLYDHSTTRSQNGRANGADADTSLLFKQDVKLAENDEILLLEILNAGVKSGLSHLRSASHDRSKKTTAAQKRADQEIVDTGSRHLASLIPKLLNKFGAIPDAASAVLRLQHALDPETQDSTAYSALLDDVKKQFLTHAKPSVLEEASLAFLHARTGDTDELAQGKVTSLAEDAIDKLNILAKGRNLSTRGNLSDTMLAVLQGSVLRLEMLGRIEDICGLLETKAPAAKRKNAPPQASPVDTLLTVLDRGAMSDESLDSAVSAQEDSVTLHTTRALGFYFLWKVLALRKQIASTVTIPPSTLESIASRKDRFTDSVTKIIRTRSGADETRLILCGALIDLHVAFASLLHVKPSKRPGRPASDGAGPAASDDAAYEQLASELPKSTQTLLTHILSAAEKVFAKRSKRTLQDPEEDAVEDEPQTDDEPESEPEEDEEQENDDENDPAEPLSAAAEARLAASLASEQRLCEFASKLVLGIWSSVIDGKHEGSEPGVAKRVKRNRARLGANFKAVVDALERGGPGSSAAKGGRAKSASATTAPQKKGGSAAGKMMKSAELVESDDDENDDENQQEQEDLQMEDDDAARERESTVDGAAANDEVESVLGD